MNTFVAALKTALQRYAARLAGWTKPEARSWQAGGNTVLLVGLLVYAAWLALASAGPLVMRAASLGFFAVAGLLAVLGMQLVSLLLGWLNRVPDRFRWRWLSGLFLVLVTILNLRMPGPLLLAAVVALAAALLGGASWVLLRGWQGLAVGRRVVLLLAALLGAAGLAAAIWLFASPGLEPRPQVAAAQSGTPLARVELENPGLPGPYSVAALTYGSGTDRYRPEFGEKVVIKTRPVDGSRLLASTWQGLSLRLRPLLWGFGPQALPLNGRVWYPQAGPSAGPYPLVLVVHGNHDMADFSDTGYAYLGELLASRGFIMVSVDENFLNGGFIDLLGPTQNENDARAWLMLEHLSAWHAWNQDQTSPFYGMVDLQNIAVMGHSRGGEAAALAAAFNRLPAFPENASQVFDYGYQIRAVVAIAPIDGQYWPAERGTLLKDVDYLVLHGTHDADVSSFDGINQYERVQLSPGSNTFKAALYIYRANHGQFNSSWGNRDYSAFTSEFINRKALLSAAEQQQVAGVYISAFLEASLHGQAGYRPLFQDARAAGAGWLPDTIYLNRYAEAGEQLLAGFEEDINLHTASLPGSTIAGEGLALWQEGRIQQRWGGGETGVVTLGWAEDRVASYTITLGSDSPSPDPNGVLVFSLADALRDPPSKVEKASAVEPGARQPLDLLVVLIDAAGRQAGLPLSTRMPVQPQLLVDVWKLPLFFGRSPSEAVLQSYAFALSEFTAANPNFDLSQVRAVRFVFTRTPRGSLVLDGVGFRP